MEPQQEWRGKRLRGQAKWEALVKKREAKAKQESERLAMRARLLKKMIMGHPSLWES